jgi:hypothetical protein
MGSTSDDDFGRDLYEQRPEPTDDYVASVARSVRAGTRSRTAPRIFVAVVASLLAVTALAVTGGMAQATDAPKSVVQIVKKTVTKKTVAKKTVAKNSAARPQSVTLSQVTNSPATDQYGEKPKCNSGRGNGSEGDDSQFIDPHSGRTGPGTFPTVDCDPGNSGDQNRGGD